MLSISSALEALHRAWLGDCLCLRIYWMDGCVSQKHREYNRLHLELKQYEQIGKVRTEMYLHQYKMASTMKELYFIVKLLLHLSLFLFSYERSKNNSMSFTYCLPSKCSVFFEHPLKMSYKQHASES